MQNLSEHCLDEIPEDTPIDNYLYWDGENRTGIYKPAYKYAMDLTIKETEQAVE